LTRRQHICIYWFEHGDNAVVLPKDVRAESVSTLDLRPEQCLQIKGSGIRPGRSCYLQTDLKHSVAETTDLDSEFRTYALPRILYKNSILLVGRSS